MSDGGDESPPAPPPPPHDDWRRRGRGRGPTIACGLLIALHAVLLGWAATANSVTFDEYAHLPAGVSYWRTGNFSVYNLSPPLLRLWGALPAVLAGADAPPIEPYLAMHPKDRHWNYAEAFLRANVTRYQKLFVLGRLAMIPLSCFGAWIVYRWATTLYGGWGGVAACAAYALCPNICAHAAIVGTDAGTAVFLLAACWLWWRYCTRRGRPRLTLALAAVTIGLAHLCKFTALLLWPVLIAIALLAMMSATSPRREWKRLAAGLAISFVTTVLLVNACYGFRGSLSPLGDYAPLSRGIAAIQPYLPRWLPVPAPRQYVLGFDAQAWEIEQRYPAFLLGETYRGVRAAYYPVALLTKIPLPTLALLALAGVSLIGPLPRVGAGRRDELVPILAAAILFLGMAVGARINIGIRYLLPVLPFAFILVGRLVAPARPPAPPRPRWLIGTSSALLALLLAANLSAAPRYLPFFNIFGGGPARASQILNDSNFDWGQSLIDLKRWMDEHGVTRVHLGYFGRVDPSVYDIDSVPLNEPSGDRFVVISGYYLTGLGHRMPTRHGPTNFIAIPFYRELRDKQPVALVGGTLFVYERAAVAEAMREFQQQNQR
jgi:hypothetical protein